MQMDYYNEFVAVVPSDTVNGPFLDGRKLFYALFIGTSTAAQTLAVVREDGSVVSFVNPLQGTILPIVGKRVNSTGTSVANIVALRRV